MHESVQNRPEPCKTGSKRLKGPALGGLKKLEGTWDHREEDGPFGDGRERYLGVKRAGAPRRPATATTAFLAAPANIWVSCERLSDC